jgi:hypothetical protein
MPPQNTPVPPAAPPPPATQTTVVSGTPAPTAPVIGSPEQIYRGLREKREVLWNQKSRLENERDEIAQQIRQGPVGDVDKSGLEQRLAQVDQAIAKVSIDIAEADAQVAQAASVPGAIVEPPPRNAWEFGPPVELVAMSIGLTALLLFPVCLAWARRLWRKANVVSVVPPELVEKMANMERSIDAVAIEVERIGEGTRFVTQLLAERADGARVALPRVESPSSGDAAGR